MSWPLSPYAFWGRLWVRVRWPRWIDVQWPTAVLEIPFPHEFDSFWGCNVWFQLCMFGRSHEVRIDDTIDTQHQLSLGNYSRVHTVTKNFFQMPWLRNVAHIGLFLVTQLFDFALIQIKWASIAWHECLLTNYRQKLTQHSSGFLLHSFVLVWSVISFASLIFTA